MQTSLWLIVTLLNGHEFMFIREGEEPKQYIEFDDEFYAIYDSVKLEDGLLDNPLFELMEEPYSLGLLRQIFYLE